MKLEAVKSRAKRGLVNKYPQKIEGGDAKDKQCGGKVDGEESDGEDHNG